MRSLNISFHRNDTRCHLGLCNHFLICLPIVPLIQSYLDTVDDNRNINRKKVVMGRDPCASNNAALARYLTLAPLDSCEKRKVFQDVVHTGLDILMPVKQIRTCTADAPWMNQRLKSLILKRQKTFNVHGVESVKFRYFRNLVNRERKTWRAKYYDSRIQHLKGENPKKWWDEVNDLVVQR